jgi:hypothetical protein
LHFPPPDILIFVPGRAFRSSSVIEQLLPERSDARLAATAAHIPAAPLPMIRRAVCRTSEASTPLSVIFVVSIKNKRQAGRQQQNI